jgi:hypothetical protein
VGTNTLRKYILSSSGRGEFHPKDGSKQMFTTSKKFYTFPFEIFFENVKIFNKTSKISSNTRNSKQRP